MKYPTTLNVRQAVPTDLPQLSMLFDAYRVWYGKSADVEAAQAFLAKRMEAGESVTFVAEEDGQLLGFTQLYPLFSSTRMARLWLLNDLFVAEEARGKGVSVLLIEQAKVLVRESGACGMFLETGVDNEIGNQLYPRTGFALNESTNYYEWNVK